MDEPLSAPKKKPEEALSYKYIFKLPSGETKAFSVHLEKASLSLLFPEKTSLPEWTKLSYRQCANCPLNEQDSPRCPAAVSIVDVVEFFASAISYDKVLVRVEGPERVYEKLTPLQKALSGLIGLLMAASGCPVTSKLKPLIRHHLPFSDLKETQFRILSMYLMAQYLRAKNGKPADWTLAQLEQMYSQIQKVNEGFAHRIRSATKGDANPNALAILGAFTEGVSFSIKGFMLDDLELAFKTHLE